MRRDAWIGVLVAVVCLCAACGGGGDDGRGCNYPGMGFCFGNWTFPPGAEPQWERMKQSCQSNGGVWQSCPAANRAGTCTGTFAGGMTSDVVFYVGLVCSDAEGEARCQDTTGPESVSYTPGPAHCGPTSQHAIACDLPRLSACESFEGPMSAERTEYLLGACAAEGGTVVSSCSATNRVATCAYLWDEYGGVTALATFYPGANLDGVHSSCIDLGGTWTDYTVR